MEVLSVGHCTLDQIGLVEHFARDDEEVQMPTFSVQGGGTAATAAVALARWGVATEFVGKVGDDDRGALIERTLSDEGVDTEQMIRQPHKISQVRFVIVESGSGQRHTYFTPGNVDPIDAKEFDTDRVDEYALVVVDGKVPEAQIEVMMRARSRGIPVVYEADRDHHVIEECVDHTDVVVASERVASAFTGVGSLKGMCEAFLERGPEQAIVTLGDEGAVAMGRKTPLVQVEAREVDVVDITGASDVFFGAVALGVLEQWELERTVRFANAAAGHACTGPGGRSAIAERDELEAMIDGQDRSGERRR